MFNIGDTAPDFTVNNHSGESVSLSALKGKNVVLFFYPKADTPGWTIEACSFRDAQSQFDSANTVLLGISPNTEKEQGAFASKYGLMMQLLADHDHAIAEAYGIWGEKNMYGKKYMGVDRTTFVIGPDGKFAHIFLKVKPDGHADEVLKALS